MLGGVDDIDWLNLSTQSQRNQSRFVIHISSFKSGRQINRKICGFCFQKIIKYQAGWDEKMAVHSWFLYVFLSALNT